MFNLIFENRILASSTSRAQLLSEAEDHHCKMRGLTTVAACLAADFHGFYLSDLPKLGYSIKKA